MEYSCQTYELKCNECGRRYGNRPLSGCPDCLAPLEITYDFEAIQKQTPVTRQSIQQGPHNIWRYSALLPIPEGFEPDLPVGFTPLIRAKNLGKRIGAANLFVKNDSVCFPTLSFKDRVVSVALANAQKFGFTTVGCSSTGNLANSVAAQAARLGLDACILVPADLEPAKILNTLVYGARLVRIDGNYDHVNRLCTQIADEYAWGFVNVNLRPYYAEGSKTQGFEIAEQLGWRLPDNVVCPMAGGSLIRKLKKAFGELVALGLVQDKARPLLRSPGHRLLPHRPRPSARAGTTLSLSAPTPSPARSPSATRQTAPPPGKMIRSTGGWAEDVSDIEVVSGMQELARNRRHLYRNRRRRHHCRHRPPLRPGPHLARRNHRRLQSPATASRPPTPSPAASRTSTPAPSAPASPTSQTTSANSTATSNPR